MDTCAIFERNLRFLLVEPDTIFRKQVKEAFEACSFEVTAVGRATTALSMLKNDKHSFDCVVVEVEMPDMDVLKFLKAALLTKDIPVALLSASTHFDVSLARAGFGNGACHILSKPITAKVVEKLWVYVYQKHQEKIRRFQSEELGDSGKDSHKGVISEEKEIIEPKKKTNRLCWTIELHDKFMNAVDTLGEDAVPTKILELMNVPELKKKHVASHLQKYRLHLQNRTELPSPVYEMNRFYKNSTVNKQIYSGPVGGNVNSGQIYSFEPNNLFLE